MGYCIDQIDSEFNIPADKLGDVKTAILNIFNRSGKKQIGWVRQEAITASKDLPSLFQEFRFEVDVEPETGAVYGINFIGEKAGDDIDALFNAIAPYVVDGSYVEFHGEDGAQWRHLFKGGKVTEQEAKVSYDE